MDAFETMLHRLLAALSRWLDPVDSGLQRLGLSLRQQMDALGVPLGWHGGVLAFVWVLILVMVVRTLAGWWRLLAVLVAVAVVAKVYGGLPGF